MTIRRKPFNHNALSNVLRNGALSVADLERFASSARVVDWTPTLTGPASTVVLDLGKQIQMNNVWFGWFMFRFTGLVSPGVGPYWLDTGVDMVTDLASFFTHPVGTWGAYDGANIAQGNILPYFTAVGPTSKVRMVYPATWPGGVATSVGPAAPFVWATQAQISGMITMPVLDGFHPV